MARKAAKRSVNCNDHLNRLALMRNSRKSAIYYTGSTVIGIPETASSLLTRVRATGKPENASRNGATTCER